MPASVRTVKRSIATTVLLLIFPAVLFMTALFVRNLQPPQYEPAHTAQRIVAWFSARPNLGLSVLLIGCPLAVLGLGVATLRHTWRTEDTLRNAARQTWGAMRGHLATLLIAIATVAAALILAIVTLHVLTG
jgi:hypothetical protein